jgi:hypothetical protein
MALNRAVEISRNSQMSGPASILDLEPVPPLLCDGELLMVASVLSDEIDDGLLGFVGKGCHLHLSNQRGQVFVVFWPGKQARSKILILGIAV